MNYFEKKQIHSCFASYSSGDVFVCREITRKDFLARTGEKIISRDYGFSLCFAQSDEKYCDVRKGFSYHIPKDELDAYVKATYLDSGWVLEHPFLKSALTNYYADQSAKDTARRIKQGYVFADYETQKASTPKVRQGGFSNQVFNQPDLYSYATQPYIWGFIGHFVRKPKLDTYLEKHFLIANNDVSLFAMWLTSTGGRHFGDSLEGYSFTDQKHIIRKNVQAILNEALRYRAENLERK